MLVIIFYVIEHYRQFYTYDYIFSKILGSLIVAGSVFIYVPQITKIGTESSAEGISAAMFYLEYVNLMQTTAFSYHSKINFTVYGDNVFLCI